MKVKSVSRMGGVANGEPKKLNRIRVVRTADCFACQSRDQSEWCALVDEDLRLLDRSKTCNVF